MVRGFEKICSSNESKRCGAEAEAAVASHLFHHGAGKHKTGRSRNEVNSQATSVEVLRASQGVSQQSASMPVRSLTPTTPMQALAGCPAATARLSRAWALRKVREGQAQEGWLCQVTPGAAISVGRRGDGTEGLRLHARVREWSREPKAGWSLRWKLSGPGQDGQWHNAEVRAYARVQVVRRA